MFRCFEARRSCPTMRSNLLRPRERKNARQCAHLDTQGFWRVLTPEERTWWPRSSRTWSPAYDSRVVDLAVSAHKTCTQCGRCMRNGTAHLLVQSWRPDDHLRLRHRRLPSCGSHSRGTQPDASTQQQSCLGDGEARLLRQGDKRDGPSWGSGSAAPRHLRPRCCLG